MVAQNVVIRECQQAGQAFDIAAEMVRHMESHEIDSNGETIATEETRYYRCQTLDTGTRFARWMEMKIIQTATTNHQMNRSLKMKLE